MFQRAVLTWHLRSSMVCVIDDMFLLAELWRWARAGRGGPQH